eukprot:1459157-Amphidinium_carterae.1
MSSKRGNLRDNEFGDSLASGMSWWESIDPMPPQVVPLACRTGLSEEGFTVSTDQSIKQALS